MVAVPPVLRAGVHGLAELCARRPGSRVRWLSGLGVREKTARGLARGGIYGGRVSNFAKVKRDAANTPAP